MAHPRTLADWEALTGDEALSEAEKYLIKCCREGDVCELGDGTRPDKSDPKRNIRAELLRSLILSSEVDYQPPRTGLLLRGAFIIGRLDLSFCKVDIPIGFERCRFRTKFIAMKSKMITLNFDGSYCAGLDLQQSYIEGSLFLRNDFCCLGLADLKSATIGGQISCSGGQFRSEALDDDGRKVVLNANRTTTGGDVLLTNEFYANGEVSFVAANVGGILSAEGGRFRHAPNDNLKFPLAFNGQSLFANNGIIWRNVSVSKGAVHFVSARTKDLVDDLDSWPLHSSVILDGFEHERITASFLDIQSRIEWLKRGDNWQGVFFPHPYTQLAKVLRDMGHDRDARLVLIEKEKKLTAEQVKQDRKIAKELWHAKDQSIRGDIGWHWLRRTGFRLWNGVSRRFVGYGYAPQYAFYWTVCILAALTMFYFVLWKAGGMVPNTPVVLNSEAWAEALKINPTAPGPVWAAGDVGRHYETFYAFFYAADVFIPLIDFGQESAWTGTTENWAGWMAFFLGFFFKAFGWFITALGAAAITGIIRRD